MDLDRKIPENSDGTLSLVEGCSWAGPGVQVFSKRRLSARLQSSCAESAESRMRTLDRVPISTPPAGRLVQRVRCSGENVENT